VHHRRHKESEIVFAGPQGVALLDFEYVPFQVDFIKLLEHGKGFLIANNGQTWVTPQQFRDRLTVIVFNMVDHQVIQMATVQNSA